jgi:hypothetical protein
MKPATLNIGTLFHAHLTCVTLTLRAAIDGATNADQFALAREIAC